jgi:hypothetical protein
MWVLTNLKGAIILVYAYLAWHSHAARLNFHSDAGDADQRLAHPKATTDVLSGTAEPPFIEEHVICAHNMLCILASLRYRSNESWSDCDPGAATDPGGLRRGHREQPIATKLPFLPETVGTKTAFVGTRGGQRKSLFLGQLLIFYIDQIEFVPIVPTLLDPIFFARGIFSEQEQNSLQGCTPPFRELGTKPSIRSIPRGNSQVKSCSHSAGTAGNTLRTATVPRPGTFWASFVSMEQFVLRQDNTDSSARTPFVSPCVAN